MLYISPAKAYAEREEQFDEEWIDNLRLQLNDYTSTVEELYVKLISKFLRDLALESLSHPESPFQLNLVRVVDENDNVVYKTFHAVVQGIAEDADGNTVYFTTAGPITVLP